MIPKKILENYNIEIIDYKKGEIIFEKGNIAKFYFQIIFGGVKMNNFNDKGNEYIQGLFGKNKSFGESPLLIDFKYPANAVAITNTKLHRLSKQEFITLLLNHNDIHFNFTKLISKKLYFKAQIANGITSNSAQEAIVTLFDYLKYDIHNNIVPFGLKIELTRKSIAGLLGLSIETTIRKIKELERNNTLKIIEKSIYY